MKLVYQNWSKESVNDELIKNDIRLLSKGALEISENEDLNSLSRANKFRDKPENNNRKGGGGGGGKYQQHRNNNNKNKNFKKKR